MNAPGTPPSPDAEITRRRIRRAFDRAAATYDDAAVLQREISQRLWEQLEVMQLTPTRILDAGCGTGASLGRFAERWPDARVLGLDLSEAMLRRACGQRSASAVPHWLRALLRRPPSATPLCADLARLPLRADSLDLVWSNLALQWVDDLETAFREFYRVLRPGGLLLFSSFGPDTLRELRAAFAGLDGYTHVNRFADMHDVGDALVHAGFSNPVMAMETLTLTYDDLATLLRDLKGIGAQTVREVPRPGLMGRREWQHLRANYESFRRDGRLPATYEVVYGHAWVGETKARADGRQVIQFKIEQRRAGLR